MSLIRAYWQKIANQQELERKLRRLVNQRNYWRNRTIGKPRRRRRRR